MTTTRAIVYLIGAGPGDPGLISARGLQCLAAADVVVYDHLVPSRLLSHARESAERIDVGAKSPKPLEEQAICYLLAEKAREGQTVARLKFGDPFLFDPSGEEALFLHEYGVPFEVVPGVPVSIAVPAYAGIPVTYAGGGDALVVLRGQPGGDRRGTLPRVDWEAVARIDGAVVCHAPISQLMAVVQALLKHGRPVEEPAAVIANGTLPTQQTVQATLGEIALAAADLPGRQSAVLVVGRVAAFREHLRWFDERPLFGKRVLVTRARHQAQELVDRLELLGAETIEAPTIQVLPPEDAEPLAAACANAGAFDWVVFTSTNGVDAFMSRLMAGSGDVRDLKGVRCCTVGPATADRLRRYGIKVDLIPAEYRTEAIISALTDADDLNGRQILLPRADIARKSLATELASAGAIVTDVTAYRTALVDIDGEGAPDVYAMFLEQQIDIVTFTSASTVRNFVQLYGTEAAPDLLRPTTVACIGPVTAEAAERLGISTSVMPSEYTVPALVEAIAAHVHQQSPDTESSS